ncbi:hypothetical protein [Erythrobacter aureus]|uniref:Uncharacterized protein n=1 Tax=Erythrobacter aureus TaxID=2182384 RepID=A0A345YJK5_9SPHN|nr:hypothetical protein [Erythrobacter aureus]AXK44107.1 hypothetical protein DVR09_16780 [Erythrobacter aureus]
MMTDASAGSVSFASDDDEGIEDVDAGAESAELVDEVPSDDVKPKRKFGSKAKDKKPKKAKKPKVKEVSAEEMPLPTQVNIDFLRGITKVSEAELLGRAFIEKNFDAPNASFVYVQKWRDGCVIEMQEGGGYAYLPELLAKLDENPDAVVALPMSGRMLQVKIDSETGTLEAVLLATSQEPPANAFIALPTAKMSAFDRRGSKVFAAGVGLLGASTIALAFSVAGLFIDTEAWALPYVQQTAVEDLPSAQADSLVQALSGADCIAKMEYAQGSWKIVRGWDNGVGMCSSSSQPAPSGEAAVGGVDPLEGGPPLPGSMPLPGAIPVPGPGVAPMPAPPTPGGM